MNSYQKKQTIIELTSYLAHKHYCENDSEAVVALFDDPFSWLGAGEEEYAVGRETVTNIFRQFQGGIPKCNISDEEYDVIEITPEVFLCTGRMWITTDPSTNMYLRVHQRITAAFRWIGDSARCCHIHISNPYMEMSSNEIGFPSQMGQQSYEYLQQCILEQKKQIHEQTAMLKRMSYEDSLTGLYNRNKFDQKADNYNGNGENRLGVACFDLNGLKTINDQMGHLTGDDTLRRTADHLKQFFHKKAYRIGGDEFVVIDEDSSEDDFHTTVLSVHKAMEEDCINVSIGVCWRSSQCNIREQFDIADRRMYEEKMHYYSEHSHDRRKNGRR